MVRYVIVLACAVFALSAMSSSAHALLLTPGLGSAVRIIIEPSHPRPGDTVHVSLESAVFDVTGSQIEWRVGGTVLVGGKGVTEVEVKAGKIGTRTIVHADLVAPDGTPASAEVAIVPAEVDLLYGSDSYVPPFYRGRALPSAGSRLLLAADARLKRPGGEFVSPTDIIYTWRRDGQVLGSLSGRGRSAIAVSSPFPRSATVISVEVHDVAETLSAEASVTVPAAAVSLRMYEDHPLFGVRYGIALGTTTSLADSEATFSAIPYFASAGSPADDTLSYEWSVNEKTIRTSGGAKNKIAIGGTQSSEMSQDQSSGGDVASVSARISLSLSHAANPFLDASGIWRITLGRLPTKDIFGAPQQ